jgi:hypothetical protein
MTLMRLDAKGCIDPLAALFMYLSYYEYFLVYYHLITGSEQDRMPPTRQEILTPS